MILISPIYTKSFPDLARLASGMRIADELREKTRDGKTLITITIYKAFMDKKPLMVILKEIKEMARDNRDMIENEIGAGLLHEIETILLPRDSEK